MHDNNSDVAELGLRMPGYRLAQSYSLYRRIISKMRFRALRVLSFHLLSKNMGRLADRLRELTAEMKESDARLQRLIDEHVTSTTASLEELKRLNRN